MAIRLGDNINIATSTQQPGGLLNLQKGQLLNLTKSAPGLKNVVLAGGWDPNVQASENFDIDIAALLLNANGKVANIPNDVIFFNNRSSKGIEIDGDNRSGIGEGDDERIRINLNQLDPSVERIVFVVTIFDAISRRQSFKMVQNAYVRLLDVEQNEKEILRYNLQQDGTDNTAVIFAELTRINGDWNFKAVGDPRIADLNGILTMYI